MGWRFGDGPGYPEHALLEKQGYTPFLKRLASPQGNKGYLFHLL